MMTRKKTEPGFKPQVYDAMARVYASLTRAVTMGVACLSLLCICAGPASPASETSALTLKCVEQAAAEMNVPLKLLWGILSVESGCVGSASPNTNGTYDYGPMQINTIWLPEVKKRFNATEYDLRNNACLNVRVGAWILHQELEKDPSWNGVAAYHSRTPQFAERYLRLLKNRLGALDIKKLVAKVNKGIGSHQPDMPFGLNPTAPGFQAANKSVDDMNLPHPAAIDTSSRQTVTLLNAACVEKAAKDMNVSLSVLLGVLATEQGSAGRVTKRADGSFDYGPMQVNSRWAPQIEKRLGISKDRLICDSCLNVRAGAWVLRQNIEKNPTWAGVAAYRSHTPETAQRYLAELLTNIYSLDLPKLLERINKGRPSTN